MGLREIILGSALLGLSLGQVNAQSQEKPKMKYRSFKTTDGTTVSISNKVGNNLGYIYGNSDNELPLCLFGEKKNDSTYVINDLDFPFYLHSSKRAAAFINYGCREEDGYLGMVHNHPNSNLCFPSVIDLTRFYHKENQGDLEMIVCEPNGDNLFNFEVFRKTDRLRKVYKELILDKIEKN